ncbi:MAG: division/cell wall cluster transcriptional repressor MraZ [Candidatus Kryptoniota bacterium]
MSSFKGRYEYVLDSKGRLSIPAKLRKSLSPEANDTFVVTRGIEKCLYVYPLDEWRQLESKLRSLNQFVEKHRFFTRTLLMWASEEFTLDSQSRISIPRNLLEFAGIEKEVIVIGALERIELWSPKNFDDYMNSQTESYESVVEKIMSVNVSGS